MENYDPRRRPARDDRQRHSQWGEDRGRDREWWHMRDDDRRREQRGWLDYDTSYGRSEDRYGERSGREEERSGHERANFSPDWSREGAEPRYSDEPYYSRNRDRGDRSEQIGRSYRGDDDRSRWDQRSRSSIPPEQRQLAERSRSGDYYSPDWPYEEGRQDRQGGMQSSRREDQDSYYQGYYSRSATPFRYAGGSGMMYSESLTLHGPYTGRGPKGYKRSDQQIIEEACQRLERDGEVDASDIEVSADDGVLILRGMVDDRATKRRAEECVESIYGVRDVMNELRVSASGREMLQGSQGSASASQGSQGSQKTRSSRASQASGASPTGQNPQATVGTQSGRGAAGSSSPGSEQTGEQKH